MDTMTFLFVVLVVISLNVGTTVESVCEKRDTCADNRNRNIPLCYCDEDCFHYKDCCKEYVSEQKFDSDNQNITKQHCILLTNEQYMVGERVGAFMIDSCNGSSMPCTLKDNDLKSMLPVSSDDNTYKNDECALCNGVSKFRYWTVVFSNTDENVLFQLSSQNLSKDRATKFLINEGNADSLVVFHPPVDVEPRFCPYDILLAENVQRKSPHQNPLSCNLVYFKNIEACKAEGCCNPDDDMWCIDFELPYYAAQNSVRGSAFGIQLTLSYGAFESTKVPSQKTEVEEETMTFENMKVHMVFDFQLENIDVNRSYQEIDDCVQGILLLLASKPFYLHSTSGTFRAFSMGNGSYVTLQYLQSHAAINFSLMKVLLRLKRSFICQTKYKATIKGNVKAVSSADVQRLFWTFLNDIDGIGVKVKLTNYILEEDPEVTIICESIMLSLEERMSKTLVRLRCDDAMENVNAAFLPEKSFATFVFLFFVTLTFHTEY